MSTDEKKWDDLTDEEKKERKAKRKARKKKLREMEEAMNADSPLEPTENERIRLKQKKLRKMRKKRGETDPIYQKMRERARELYFVVEYSDSGEILHQYTVRNIVEKLMEEYEQAVALSTCYFWARTPEIDGTSWQTKFDLVIKEGLTLKDLEEMGIDDSAPESLVDRILVKKIAETHQSDIKIERTSASGLEKYASIVLDKLEIINAMTQTIKDEVARKVPADKMTYDWSDVPKLTPQEMKVFQELNDTARGRVDKRREHVMGDVGGDASLREILSND